MSKITQFASESVCAGHPDKIADAISDAILDAVLKQDAKARTAVEVLVAADRIVLAGEVNTTAKVDFEAVAREQVRRLGYTNPAWAFTDQSKIENYLHQQSSEIAVGTDNDDGAGDQGMMFGFATNETPEYLPTPIALAHALTRGLDAAREQQTLPYLRPDGKAQVVVNYEDSKPVSVDHVTIAVPHNEDITLEQVQKDVYEQIIVPTLQKYGYSVPLSKVVVNGTGVWYTPGPTSDAGLTGRKIVVDGYGGFARVGGGAFSGKDPSKVDRSGAYAARYIAKNIVAAGLADECEVALAYYIGAKEPVMLTINSFSTAKKSEEELYEFAKNLLVPSVKNIVEQLRLRQPIYLQTTAYGHFGKPDLPWEQIVLQA
ncbi:MAG TPA: methionine adenosyltransferase [Candidatus Saccharimonadales bacterium]|nr:methionine adenosyltransferase [Candidatus Saccharimonadales bacterium]